MSGERKDGGLAFPGSRFENVTYVNGGTQKVLAEHPGMSLRDYFAAQALADLACNVEYELTEHLQGVHHPTKDIPPNSADQIAELCYRIADAMLKQRDKGKG